MLTDSIKANLLRQGGLGLPWRLAILAVIFFADKMLLNNFVDFDRTQTAQGLGGFVRAAQHLGFRFLVALIAAVVVFGYVRGGQPLRMAASSLRASNLRVRWLALHVLLILALIPVSFWLYRDDVSPLPFPAVAIIWIGLALISAGSAVLGFGPAAKWLAVVRSLGILWPYALMAALLGAGAMQLSQLLWEPTTALTFSMVRFILLPFLPNLITDTATRSLGTERFDIEITDECSGLEGLGLVLAFSAAWLFYFRHEYFFPRALLLIPAGLVAIFLLNILRIAALMVIGNAGFPEVAEFGFHSQAGWIAFNAVACGLVYFSRKSGWLNRGAANPHQSTDTDNPTAAYLMPLLALLAAGSLSHAMSGRFETFYPLRLIAGAAALWIYRHKLATLDWQVGWRAAAIGVAVFVIWMLGAHWIAVPASMPDSLASMSAGARDTWLASRVIASVLVVPVAEELAYRGYLMRRLSNRDFESVPLRSIGWFPLTATALLFGVAHGAFWLPGVAAGIAYGLLAVRKGYIGEAVVAHAVTNLLVAIAVIYYGQWQLW